MAAEQKRLTGLYKDITDCIPVLLEDNKGLPINEIYAPLLIQEDLDAMKRTWRPDEPSGSKTLDSVRDVFFFRDRDRDEKLSTRILIKGEAGSGKSVFCLKLVENWCQLRQSGKHEHVCEKHSELIVRLEKDHELPWLFNELKVYSDLDLLDCLPEIPCTACEMTQCLSQFDLLYYVPLRDATEGKTSVLDLVCDAVCKKRQNVIDRTKHLLDNDNICCLIVLDGVDEWPHPPGFNGLPNSDGLSDNCVLLWTMRPWKLVHLQLKPKHDDHIVTVSGLSPYSVAKVIENILIRFYGLNGEELKTRFLAYCEKVIDKTIESIMRMPIMLIAACHLWQKEEAISSNKPSDTKQSFSKTHMYLSLLDLMIQNASRKESKQGSMEQNLTALISSGQEYSPISRCGLPNIMKKFHHVSHFIDMLLPFCELAFTDLMSSETKLVFHKGQLESKLGPQKVNLAQRLGLISQAKVRSDIGCPQNVSVSFYHKSVEELLAAMYVTCGPPDAVTSFCKYCSTLEKVMETENLTMFVLGLDPSLGSRICKHITNIVTNDQDFTEYRQSLDNKKCNRVIQLYKTQCEWYRELTHNRTVTGDTSPPPSLHVTDIYPDMFSDSDTVMLTGELMSANLHSIVSVTLSRIFISHLGSIDSMWLEQIEHTLPRVIQCLTLCPHLSTLRINHNDQLVAVIPRLTQLTVLSYHCGKRSYADHTVVSAIMTLTQLVCIQLWSVSLYDGLVVTDMTRLQTLELHNVHMSDTNWWRFVTSLLTLPQESVHVKLYETNIDKETLTRVQNSPHLTMTQDCEVWNVNSRYEMLEFTTGVDRQNSKHK